MIEPLLFVCMSLLFLILLKLHYHVAASIDELRETLKRGAKVGESLTIQRILRHSDVTTTRKSYIKTIPRQVVDAMEQLQAVVGRELTRMEILQ